MASNTLFPEDIRKLTVLQLRDELRSRELDTTGQKAELITRLISSIWNSAAIAGLSVPQLRKELTALGLDSSGLKAQLVSRLQSSLPSPSSSTQPDSEREREPRHPTNDEDQLRTTIVSVMAETLPTLLASLPQPPQPTLPVSAPPPTLSSHAPPAVPPPPQLAQPIPALAQPIPARLRERILSGEFVDLSELLPQISTTHSVASSQANITHFEMSQGGGLRMVEESSVRGRGRHVCDLSTWLEAYTVFLQCILQVAPHRATELIAYQSLIIEANRRFTPEGWLDYDRQFRLLAAASPTRRWDIIDGNLWQLATTGRARQACSFCGMTHQPFPSGRCLFRQSRQPPSGAVSTDFHNGRPICRNYQLNRCSHSCGRAHVCSICRGGHPSQRCRQGGNGAATGTKPSSTHAKAQ